MDTHRLAMAKELAASSLAHTKGGGAAHVPPEALSAAAVYRVLHSTRYSYSQPVSLSHHAAHLLPRSYGRQTCLSQRLEVSPQPSSMHMRPDFFGNPLALFTVAQQHQSLTVTAESRLAVHPPPLPSFADSPPWEEVAAVLGQESRCAGHDDWKEVAAVLFPSALVPRVEEPVALASLRALAGDCFTAGRPLLEAALALTQTIFQAFAYDPVATDIATPLHQVLSERRGVCQDFAHVQIAVLRSLGLAARYVSGYLLTHPPAGAERLIGADASHAWVSLWCPEVGWVDFDPTNGVVAQHEHIVTAWGRDFDDVSPLKGVMVGGGHHTIEVGVTVLPLPPLALALETGDTP